MIMVPVSTESSQYNSTVEDVSFSILNTASQVELTKFRELERLSKKVIKESSHLSFNETCINNELLPTYTNIRLHDEAAQGEAFVNQFRSELILREIKESKSALYDLKNEFNASLQEFKRNVEPPVRLQAFLSLLNRIGEKLKTEVSDKKMSKLNRLFGAPILAKQTRDSVCNLSNVELGVDMHNIMSLGLNCHLK